MTATDQAPTGFLRGGAGRAVAITVVLLPGLDGTRAFLETVLHQLRERHPVRVVEFPPNGPNDYRTLLTHVRHATADLKEFAVIGFSFSGPLAVMLADAEPERVLAIVLAATFVRWPRPELRSLQPLFRTPTIWTIRLLRRVPGWFGAGASDRRRRAQTTTWMQVPARTIARRVRAMATVDVSQPLMHCARPVMSLRFMDDRAVPVENALEIRRCCPRAEIADVQGSHLSMLDHPQRLADPVLRFLATVEDTRVGVSRSVSPTVTPRPHRS